MSLDAGNASHQNVGPELESASQGTAWRDLRPTVRPDETEVAVRRGDILRQRLQQLRRSRGFTQSRVANRMSVSQSRVSAIEARELADTEVGTLEKYIEGLGGSVRIVASFPDGTETTLA